MSSPFLRQTGTIRRAVFAPFAPPRVETPTEPAPDALVDALMTDPATLLAEAQARAESAGYADGFACGHAAGEALYSEQAEQLRRLVDGAVHDLQTAIRQLEPQVVDLALTIAERVIEREVMTQRDLVVDVIRAALATAESLPLVRVRVHPDDHSLVSAAWASLTPSTVESTIDLVADPQIQPGGCLIDTASGLIDAQPATRLAEVRDQILAVIGGSS